MFVDCTEEGSEEQLTTPSVQAKIAIVTAKAIKIAKTLSYGIVNKRIISKLYLKIGR